MEKSNATSPLEQQRQWSILGSHRTATEPPTAASQPRSVLPRLKYLIMIQFIAAVGAAFKGGAEYVLIMTGGGPQDRTNLLSLEIFRITFMDLKYGIGTAMAWLLGGLLIGFTVYQLKLLSRAEFRAAG